MSRIERKRDREEKEGKKERYCKMQPRHATGWLYLQKAPLKNVLVT